jgi:hypothetical protein
MLRGAFGVTLFGILMTPVSSTPSAALSDGDRRPGRRHDDGLSLAHPVATPVLSASSNGEHGT